ncbi:hypothetical protein QBC38DRAFT_546395 [Podospora fimiseda]|uniref:Uncharacterized protein n=1 Tax=Podospora fimiseda TaxID=252190 RepID=A0AAN7BMA5_9PEZI|nr:hypothetical protein QBC38DRAFT_546395 [Podospora fimiseda]
MSFSPLLNVPAEIIHNICEKIINSPECIQADETGNITPPGCPIKKAPWWNTIPLYPALINLRLTCTSLAALVEPFMYRQLSIQFSQFHDPSINAETFKLLNRKPEIASRIKSLAVDTWLIKGSAIDGGYLFQEAIEKNCSLPPSINRNNSTENEEAADNLEWGKRLELLSIDLAMIYASKIEEFVLYYNLDAEPYKLGDWFPCGYEMDCLKHVQIRVGEVGDLSGAEV